MLRCGHAASYLSVPAVFVPSRRPAYLDQESRTRRRMLAQVRDLKGRSGRSAARFARCRPRRVSSQDCARPPTHSRRDRRRHRTYRPTPHGRRAQDGTTCPFGLGQHGADLLGRADVVGELEPGSTVTAERCPQAEDHPPGLKEADRIVGLLCVVPAERLIERTGSGKIGDAKRHEADALVPAEIIADAAGCLPMPRLAAPMLCTL